MLATFLRNAVVRNTLVASAFVAPIVALTAETASADKSNFWVYNNSSITVNELYVSSSNRDSWDNDILGQNVLPTGSSIQVVFGDNSPSNCLYDIRAVFSNGQVLEDYQINVCNNTDYTFFDN